ncbi:MAG: SRPBCC family protein, partial [Gemmatimonadota bacterium]|nr:SRPBCC family protein [Gemmatimonadota bacterium]
AAIAAVVRGPVQEVSRTIAVPEPPDVVWHVITDLDNLATWRRGLTRVERLPDFGGRPAWMEYRGEVQEAVRVAEAQPPLRLVTERMSSSGRRASWSWEMARTVRGSRLTLTRRVSEDPLYLRIVNGLTGRIGREVEQALADLSFRLSTGSRLRTTALNR